MVYKETLKLEHTYGNTDIQIYSNKYEICVINRQENGLHMRWYVKNTDAETIGWEEKNHSHISYNINHMSMTDNHYLFVDKISSGEKIYYSRNLFTIIGEEIIQDNTLKYDWGVTELENISKSIFNWDDILCSDGIILTNLNKSFYYSMTQINNLFKMSRDNILYDFYDFTNIHINNTEINNQDISFNVNNNIKDEYIFHKEKEYCYLYNQKYGKLYYWTMNESDTIKDGSFNNINNEITYYKIFEINKPVYTYDNMSHNDNYSYYTQRYMLQDIKYIKINNITSNISFGLSLKNDEINFYNCHIDISNKEIKISTDTIELIQIESYDILCEFNDVAEEKQQYH